MGEDDPAFRCRRVAEAREFLDSVGLTNTKIFAKLESRQVCARGCLGELFWTTSRRSQRETARACGRERTRTFSWLGDCLLGQGHPPEQALAHLSRAGELRPDALAYRALLGQVLLQSGNPRAAVVQLEQASPLDRDGSIHFQLANAYRSLGKPELARRALARQEELQQSVAGRPAESAPAAR